MNDRPKKIVHLSSVHQATDTRIFLKECRSLVHAGYDVTLIARADADNIVDGVKIRAVTSGSGNRLVRMTRSTFDVMRMAIAENGDAYQFHDPELIPVGLILKLCGKRVVYDVHENVGKQIRSKFWIPAPLRAPVSRVVRMLEQVSARVFDGVVAATPGIAKAFPGSKTVVVQNFALVQEFVSIDTDDYADRAPLAVYIGGITRTRGAEEMVRAMEYAGADTGTRLLLGGVFRPSSLETDLQSMPGYDNIDFLGWLDRDGVRIALARSRVGMLVLHPEPNYIDSYPVKLFEYMAAGIPVVASNFPFWEQFVKDTGAGLMVDPMDPSAIAKAILWLLDHPKEAQIMGEKGRVAVLDRYSWEKQSRVLLDLHDQRLLAHHSPRGVD